MEPHWTDTPGCLASCPFASLVPYTFPSRPFLYFPLFFFSTPPRKLELLQHYYIQNQSKGGGRSGLKLTRYPERRNWSEELSILCIGIRTRADAQLTAKARASKEDKSFIFLVVVGFSHYTQQIANSIQLLICVQLVF